MALGIVITMIGPIVAPGVYMRSLHASTLFQIDRRIDKYGRMDKGRYLKTDGQPSWSFCRVLVKGGGLPEAN